VADLPNVYLDLSGSGVDRGMLDRALDAVGAERLLWGCDVTMETGLAKWWALEVIAPGDEALAAIRWGNAARIFPQGSLPGIPAATGNR
jgi:predicted TIM-barrel fold metal-dependent hydrolase